MRLDRNFFSKSNLSNVFGGIQSRVNEFYDEERPVEDELVGIVKKAHDEWREAERLFQNVSDPDLVDHAIYRVEAARARYIYLVKKAKEEGIKANFY